MASIDNPTLMKFLYAFLIGIALIASILLYWYLCFAEINHLATFGLSSEEFQQIPVFLHPGRSDSSAVETACSICLEEFRRGEECLRMPACGHFFHADCVRPWLLESRTCPTCRGSVIV